MKAVLASVAVTLLSSLVYAGNCHLPSTKNPDFVADGAECNPDNDNVVIEKPKVIYFGNDRDIIVAQREGLLTFSFLYSKKELNFLCQQFGFSEYVSGSHTTIKVVGKGVVLRFNADGLVVDVEEVNKTPYRKSLKNLVCR